MIYSPHCINIMSSPEWQHIRKELDRFNIDLIETEGIGGILLETLNLIYFTTRKVLLEGQIRCYYNNFHCYYYYYHYYQYYYHAILINGRTAHRNHITRCASAIIHSTFTRYTVPRIRSA